MNARVGKTIGLAIGLAATLAFASYAVHALQHQDLSLYLTPRALLALLLASVCYASTFWLSALAWQRLLDGMGQYQSLRVLFPILAVSQVGKYLPGNVGSHVGRVVLARARSVPLQPLVASLVLEAGLGALAGLVVGLVSLSQVAPAPAWLPVSPLVALGLAAGLLLVVFLLAPLLHPRLPAFVPPLRVLGFSLLAYAAVYVLLGAGAWLMSATALPGLRHAPALLCAGFALAFLAGFFTPGAPAGLGVREGVMLLVLQTSYSPPDALFIVLGLRLATLAGDAILFLLGSAGLLAQPAPSFPQDVSPRMDNAIHLEPTGERMIQEHYASSVQDHLIYLMHAATYRFAISHVAGKRVLDYGCGSGYGSAQMAQHASMVVGVDVAPDAVEYAAAKFQADNLSFQAIDANASLPFADASFDVVLSFQVFEHVHDTQRYLAEIRRVLTPGGVLMLATPDRSTRLLPFQRPWNRWHLHEYSARELKECLLVQFPRVEMLGMGGTPEVIRIEIDRCAKVKWMTLPVTLPLIPDAWRVAGLNALHKLRGAPRTGAPTPCPFTIDDITIGKDQSPSVNLVALAYPGQSNP